LANRQVVIEKPPKVDSRWRISVRHFIWAIMVSLCAGNCLRGAGAGSDLSPLRGQLAAAEKSEDKPAIIELSRRLVAITPKDSDTWEKLARTQLEIEDLDRCGETLDAWEKAVRPAPTVVEDIRGDLFFARKDYKNAEQHWLAFLAKKPPRDDAIATYQALADLCVEQKRWRENLEFRTRVVFLHDTAANRIGRAAALLRLHRWDEAFADIRKANALDPSDETVKEWLPQFERLDNYMPKIKALEARLAKAQDDVDLLLERAHFFTLAQRPLLALDDCERAMKLQPASMRARIQMAEALLDNERADDAAKLQVSNQLRRGEDRHVSEQSLRELRKSDALLAQNQNNFDALAVRAKTLRELRQFTLALADARAALALNDKSAAAHLEVSHDLDELHESKEALVHARKATELNASDSSAWCYRGLLEAQRADFPAAIESLTRSITIQESELALTEREKCERRIGRIKEADTDLKRIQELDRVKQ
jgi:tetratricopeptide (TPR) repeat protein